MPGPLRITGKLPAILNTRFMLTKFSAWQTQTRQTWKRLLWI